jgi:predicted membrane protein
VNPEADATASAETAAPHMHLPSLAVGLVIMVGGTVYPLLMVNRAGRVDHGLALLLFWAMSAGFIRGVGFVPRAAVWRWLFSGWACALALALAAAVRWWA